MPSPLARPDHRDTVKSARLELEAASSPAYVVVLVDEGRRVHASPVVFSALKPADDQARHFASRRAIGEEVYVVSRVAERGRQVFTVLQPGTLRKLHTQHEVVEATLAEEQSAPV